MKFPDTDTHTHVWDMYTYVYTHVRIHTYARTHTHTHASVFFKATYHVDRHENMDFRLLKSTRNQESGGVDRQAPVRRLLALAGLSKALTHHKFQKIPIKNSTFNYHIKPPFKAESCQGKNDGKYLGAHGQHLPSHLPV